MYVCLYVCMHVCKKYYSLLSSFGIFINRLTLVYINVCMYVCMYVCMCRYLPPLNFETFFEVRSFALQLIYDHDEEDGSALDGGRPRKLNTTTTTTNTNTATCSTTNTMHKSANRKKR